MVNAAIRQLEIEGEKWAPYIFAGQIGTAVLGLSATSFISLVLKIGRSVNYLPCQKLLYGYESKIANCTILRNTLEIIVPSKITTVATLSEGTDLLVNQNLGPQTEYKVVIQDFSYKTLLIAYTLILGPKILSIFHGSLLKSMDFKHEAFTRRNFIYSTLLTIAVVHTFDIFLALISKLKQSNLIYTTSTKPPFLNLTTKPPLNLVIK